MSGARVLARSALWAADPVTFAIDSGFEPDERQAAILRDESPQLSIVATRQWGKSTVVSRIALRDAILTDESLVLVGAVGERQGAELLRKCRDALSVLALRGWAPETRRESVLQLELANGSRVVVLPGIEASVRGYSSPSLIIIDEAARVPDNFIYALRPMLSVGGGRMVLLTSAWLEQGYAWSVATSDDPSWSRHAITASACPRFDPTWLARERAHMGTARYEREYECRWSMSGQRLYTDDVLWLGADAITEDVAA